MPDFLISKLQFKNYEKGEFSAEQARNLDDTSSLIKSFPWDDQRGQDVQPTGPSVTIKDDEGNYLKVGVYFGGKFSLYYLSYTHQLYEYHAGSLGEAVEMAADFFNGKLDLSRFEKKRLFANPASHFEDGSFVYHVNDPKFYVIVIIEPLLMAFFISMGFEMFSMDAPVFAKIMMSLLAIFMVSLLANSLYYWIISFKRAKNMVIEISSGINEFKFGDAGNLNSYNKSDIASIIIYGRTSQKGPELLCITEVNFKDGSNIKFPGTLLAPFICALKFPNFEIARITKRKEVRRVWREFISGTQNQD